MKKPQEMQTMRRKVISDNKPVQEAAKSASNTLSGLNDISTKLDDAQAASELIAQTVEEKSNEIIGAIDNVESAVSDTTAGSELIAETVEIGNNINKEIGESLGSKLDKLTSLLEQKIQTAGIQQTGTSLAVVESAIPVKVVEDDTAEFVGPLLPAPEAVNNDPDADFFPAPQPVEPKRESPEEKQKKEAFNLKLSQALDKLTKTVDFGFKKSISITDKISSMLFKYTVSAAIEAAKMVALIMAVVIGIDLLMVHFKYWSDKFSKAWDLFSTDFKTFSSETGTWGPLLQSIFESIDEIKKFWEAGDWGGLTVAIVEGLGSVLYNLGELIQLGMAKLSAAILRVIPGMKDTADEVEGRALENFQNSTGASLNKEDQEKVANYQDKRMNDDLGPIAKGLDKIANWKTRASNWIRGVDNKEALTTDEERAAEEEKLKQLSPEERKNALMKANEARAAMIRFEKYADSADMSKDSTVKSIEAAHEDLKKRMNDPDLNNSPAVKKELASRFAKIDATYQELKKNQPEAKPETSAKSPEAKQVQVIEKNKAKQAPVQQASPSINNTNNVIKKNTVVHNMTPVTSTTAPGVFGATGVN
ncbi:baseplate hub [Yersinia phage PYps47T]|nr:baseplate hub [Yersinia phage PYps32T]QNJ50546.1 baseplate hub [Yersinia phage PYps47T]